MLLIFTENKVTLRNTHLLQVGIREGGSHPDFKGPVFYKMCNTNGKVPSHAEAMEVLHNPILPCGVISFLQIKEHRNYVLIMDESFPSKCFKSNKIINRATSGSEPTLQLVSKLWESRYHTNLRLIIRFMVLQMQHVKAIGR